MKLKTLLKLAIIATAASSIVACTQSNEKAAKVQQEMKQEFSEFKTSMDAKLAVIDSKIQKIEAGLTEKSGEVKGATAEKLDKLKELRGDLGEKIEEMSDTSRDKYADLKLNVEHSLESLQNEVKKTFN